MTLLEAQGLSRHFGGLKAVDDVSFQVARGEIVGLIGPNGAGKSTLFAMVAGALKPTSGRLRFEGVDVTGWAPHVAAAAGVGRTFQLMRVFTSMSVRDNVRAAALLRQRSPRAAGRAADAVLDEVGLGDLAAAPATALTAGLKKRLEMARALATGPKLLLLDEVLSGLTPTESQEAVGVVRRIQARGVTVVMVEHVMEVIMPLCDRVVVLHYGKKIAAGTPAEIVQDEQVLSAYLGPVTM
jgi:branched-chain amino acid transport system ATP-binding protein